jgi:hypothetical protein
MKSLSGPCRIRRRLCLGGALLLALAGNASWAADPSEFSRAEKLVFTDPHLANVKSASALRYTYVQSGTLEGGFEDTVVLNVKPVKPGFSAVKVAFLSGARQLQLPEIPEAEASPVILYFLERDIREMERVTKGKSGYFRKRIRLTMSDGASVRETTVSYGGRDVPAQEVTLAPYESDPLRARFEKYALKRYTFVLSSTVPGGVYQIKTALPGALPSDAPVLEEVMTFAGTEPYASTPSTPPTVRKP